MTSTTLSFRPQNPQEYAEYRSTCAQMYGAQMAELGGMPEEQAFAKATADIDALLPGEGLLPGHSITVGLEHEQPIGICWVGPRRDGVPGLWVFDVAVNEQHRGRGFGSALMLEAERYTRKTGGETLALNVFGGNTAAIAMYERLGYRVDAQQMSKELGDR